MTQKAFTMPDDAILYLPGLLCDQTLWHYQAQNLADLGPYQIADLTQDESIEGMASRALAGAPPRFTLIGLSMGGYVAFEIMRQTPERVTRLMLLDTSALPDKPERTAQRLAALQTLTLGRFLGVAGRMLPQLVHEKHLHDHVAEQVESMARRVGSEAFIRQQKAIMARVDSRPTLQTITVPTLVGVGEQDVLTPLKDAYLIHEQITGSHLHVFKECGHLPPLENPEETAKLLRSHIISTP